MIAIEKFLNGILEVAKFNPLAAVVILFLVLSGFVSWLTFLFFRDKRERKKNQGKFIYASGLIANLEINLKKLVEERFEELKRFVEENEGCYFTGESAEPRRQKFFDLDTRLKAMEKDVLELKQFIILGRSQ